MTRGIFVPGSNANAAELNDVFDAPRTRLRNSVDITLATAVDTAVTFNTEDFDVGGMHSTAVNTSRITIPAGGQGYYELGGNLRFATNATGTRRISMFVNGVTRIALVVLPAVTGVATCIQCSTFYQLAAGDYVELFALQDSGGNLNITADPNTSPVFWARWANVF